MRQLYFIKPGELEWRDVPDPRLQTGEDAIVRPVAASTCDLDPLLIKGHAPFAGPFALGHECVSEIVELGDHVTGLHVGQLVIVSWHISCGRCDRCRNGMPNACRAHPRACYGINSGGDWGGMFADLVYVPHATAMLVPLPPGIDPVDAASAADNLAFGYELTIPFLKGHPGAEVLVMGGCGSVGLYAAAYAVAGGASRVDYVDADPERLRIAASLGANAIEGPLKKRLGSYPLVVDASIEEDALRLALRSMEPEGQCNCVGAHLRDVRIPLQQMYANGAHLYTGRGRGLPCVHDALDFVLAGRVRPALIRTQVASFDDAIEVLLSTPVKPVFVRE